MTVDSSGVCRVISTAGNKAEINGTININSNVTFVLGVKPTGIFTFGTNSDVTGTSGHLWLTISNGATVNINKSGTFTYSGTVTLAVGSIDIAGITGDWRNASYRIWKSSDDNVSCYIEAGTLRINNFYIGSNSTNNMNVDNTNNADIYVYNDVDFDNDVGTFTTAWTRGAGTWYLMGNGSINFKNQSIENLETDAGSTNTFTEGFTCEDANFKGTQTFTEGKTYNVQNITGNGTLVAASGTVYIIYHGHNTFSGTLTNVILKQADVSGEDKYPTTVTKSNRGEVV